MSEGIQPSRRAIIGAPLLALAAITIEGIAAVPASATGRTSQPGWAGRPRRLGVRGADLSFTLQEEAAGNSYTNLQGHRHPVEKILVSAGANWARLRVWVDPPTGYSDLPAALRLAQRCRGAGLKVLLDLHYSDFWADPGKQATPAAWVGQDLTQLNETVRGYTRQVVDAFARQGTPIDMIQIGNEITNGMLWPLGQIYNDSGEHWDPLVSLLDAGLTGAREGTPRHHELATMVHIDRGGDNGGSRYFYDNIIQREVDFDIIGLSFYPFWHGPLSALQANLNDLTGRYGKDLVVAETAYPWTLADGDNLANSLNSAAQLPEATHYPATPSGQRDYFEALRNVIQQVPSGHGLGFFDWEPEWIPGVGWEPGQGNPNDNLAMFDFHGHALPALNAFRAGG
jgi:arabinogalactan endo-1,4-beta-galactosidase